MGYMCMYMYMYIHVCIYAHYECILIYTHIQRPSGTVDMDLDSEKDCQLLRVLITLSMSSHASLAAEALKLLIRHFSQRKEIVHGFKQVHICKYT